MATVPWSSHHIWDVGVTIIEHAATIMLGFVFIIVGLALGVTMIMLPVGVPLGIIGVLLVIGGLFARIDGERP